MSRQQVAESALNRIIIDSGTGELPQLNDLMNDPSFREAFPALYSALTQEREYLDTRVYTSSVSGVPFQAAAPGTSSKRVLRESLMEKPAALPNTKPEQIPRSTPAVQASAATAAQPRDPRATTNRQRLLVAGLSAEGAVDPSEKIEIVFDFVQIAYSSIQHRQEVFCAEVAKQIALVLPGLNPAIVNTEVKRVEDFVRAKVTLPAERAEQLVALYGDKANLLRHAPLLQSAEMAGKSSGKVSGSVSAPDSAALLQRLDNLVRQYSETRSKRDTLSLFHATMAMTDDMQRRAKQVVVVGNPQIYSSTAGLSGTTAPLPFPYRGVPNVLSPRGGTVTADPPGAAVQQEAGVVENFDGGNFRPVPPPAEVVESKRSMDASLAHFAGSASRLQVENKELSRAFKEAAEVAEARRLVDAGLVNPATLDLLLKTNELRHEQERQMDELRMEASEEADRRRAMELQTSNEYLKRLFAVATGELDDTQTDGVPRPSEVRKFAEVVREETVGMKRRANAARVKDRRSFAVKVETADDVPATNLLGGFMDAYVRIRVMDISTGQMKSEAQTRTASGSASPQWQETLHFEVDERAKTEAKTVLIALMGYNAVGTDSVLGETAVDYELFKRSSHGSCCWMLPCVVLDERRHISLFLTTTVENGDSSGSSEPVALSQAAARQRYWRSQAFAAQQQSDDIL